MSEASATAEPVQPATATVELPERAFQIWSATGWVSPTIAYTIHIGPSVADTRITIQFA
ncbi:MAG TPA: fibronectin type III-like domain-contianing protein [Actinokineospora sp.]|nr:fibronectin type III-like domain-contianing protein [Actinokineospora sp.]